MGLCIVGCADWNLQWLCFHSTNASTSRAKRYGLLKLAARPRLVSKLGSWHTTNDPVQHRALHVTVNFMTAASHPAQDDITTDTSDYTVGTAGGLPVANVKSNGSSLVPQQSNGGRNGGGGEGGSGGGDGSGDDNPGDGPDNNTKALLLALSVVVGGAGFYGIYHLASALQQQLFSRRQATKSAPILEQRYWSKSQMLCIFLFQYGGVLLAGHRMTLLHLNVYSERYSPIKYTWSAESQTWNPRIMN